MEQNEKTAELLIEHYRKYPCLQIQDVFKYLHQSSFGCEHMVTSLETATDYLRKEYENYSAENEPFIETLDGKYSRVNLAYLSCGLSIETFGKLFFYSSKKETEGRLDLEKKLNVAKDLVCKKILPFSPDELEKEIEKWAEKGYPSIHHSDIFRLKYKPAYRVISEKYVTYLPQFIEIDKKLAAGFAENVVADVKTIPDEIIKEIYIDFKVK